MKKNEIRFSASVKIILIMHIVCVFGVLTPETKERIGSDRHAAGACGGTCCWSFVCRVSKCLFFHVLCLWLFFDMHNHLLYVCVTQQMNICISLRRVCLLTTSLPRAIFAPQEIPINRCVYFSILCTYVSLRLFKSFRLIKFLRFFLECSRREEILCC